MPLIIPLPTQNNTSHNNTNIFCLQRFRNRDISVCEVKYRTCSRPGSYCSIIIIIVVVVSEGDGWYWFRIVPTGRLCFLRF
jgi:hypothetical protein